MRETREPDQGTTIAVPGNVAAIMAEAELLLGGYESNANIKQQLLRPAIDTVPTKYLLRCKMNGGFRECGNAACAEVDRQLRAGIDAQLTNSAVKTLSITDVKG